MATDSAWRKSTGVCGFRAFLHPLRTKRLQPNQERIFVPIGDLPEKFQSTAGKRSVRSCIEEGPVGKRKKRFEIAWSAPRPIMFSMLDMGSIGWVSKLRLYCDRRRAFHGFYDMDPPHRRHNHTHLAATAADQKWVTREVQLQAARVADCGARVSGARLPRRSGLRERCFD